MNKSNINPKLEEILDSAGAEGGIRIGDVYIPPPPLPACTFDTTEPRLIISRIENINFKSYAGLQTLGPFHKNFTAIIGANGSGKSNVIDAMLFVFGYRAQKIRSKKISVLIHNSDEHPNIESCTVKVHFHKIKDTGENTCDIIPDSTFCISRTAFRDNSSCYEIDGHRVQFKKVATLLRSYGIDLDHNRFLILQGEIEIISMMKAKSTEQGFGMLEYLEDIIGSNRFIEPIEKFSKKVEELNNIRAEKLNRLKLIEKEKDDLKVLKTDAVEYMKLENKIVSLQNLMYQGLKQIRGTEIKLAERKRDLTKEELGKLETEEEEIRCKREVKENKYAEMQAQCEKLKIECENAVEQFGELERKDVVCRADIDWTKAKIKKISGLLTEEETKLVELRKVETTRKGEVLELEKKKEKLQKKKENEESKLKEVMRSITEETNVLYDEKGRMETKLIDLKKTVFEAKAAMDIAQLKLDLLVSGERKAQARLKEFEKNLQEVTATASELKKKSDSAALEVSGTEKELQDLKNQHEEVVIEETSHSEEVRSKQAELSEASADLRVSSMSRSHNAISQFLMEQQRLGHISGILGRLGDLGEIEDKYDVAISTTCGALDNIVTETIETAQKCVEYLKEYEKGYCTFIALDKMQIWESRAKQVNIAESPYPEQVPRLFDLVKVKDVRVLPAFYFALRDTLVASDLDQATRIGMYGAKRCKVVTLKGEVIDVTGTMTGGGRVLSGRIGKSVTCANVTPQDVEKLQKSLEDAKKKAKELKGKRIDLEKKINATERHITTVKLQLSKYRIEYSSCKVREDFIAKRIPEVKSEVVAAAPDKEKLNEVMIELDRAKESYDKANEAADKVAVKVEQLLKEIISVTETKYEALKKKLDKLSKEINTVCHNINTSGVAAKTAYRNQVKAENKIKSLTEDQNETKGNLEQLKKEYEELTSKATKIVESKTGFENELKNLSDHKKSIRKEIDKEKCQELEIKKKIIDVKHNLKTLEAELKEKQDALKRIETKLAKLELQKIEEDCDDPLTLPILTPQELADVSVKAISCEMEAIEAQMAKMKPNMAAIAEYKIKEELYKVRMQELEQFTKEIEITKKHFNDLRKQRLTEFMVGFKIITLKLKEVYQMLTLGGDAELELKDPLDPFAEGILFSVRPPKKSWKNITNLSGGEKTLSSLSLVLALHYYRPTPFYVMDEIDAALDIRNVSIVGHYIKESTKNAQFIVITLRPNMFQIADSLIGIYKPSGCTNAVTVSPETLMLLAKDEHSEQKSSPGLIAAKSVCEILTVTEGHPCSSNDDSKNLDFSQIGKDAASCS